jgi:hypothetical protein
LQRERPFYLASNQDSRGFCAPIITAIVVATFAGALAVFLPGMPDMKAGPQAEAAAADRARPKADRLPILAKGPARPDKVYDRQRFFDVLRSASERPSLERLG